ncbi:MAG: hydroxymethylbilane synthase [Candidatus Bipolaricaulia bacterium]
MLLRIGTRKSKLARSQCRQVCDLLTEMGIPVEEVSVSTSGDIFNDRAIHEIKGRGAFVRELDGLLLAGELDAAVHSMKDIPTELTKGLAIAAVLKRASPFDLLITRDGLSLDDLPKGAVVGTSSVRRRAQLICHRPDLNVKNLRGNVETRLEKLSRNEYDAIVLAEAGIERLGLKRKISAWRLPFVPAPNQGAIAVTTQESGEPFRVIRRLDHPRSRIEAEAERKVMSVVGGGCASPMGILAQGQDSGVKIEAEILSPDGKHRERFSEQVSLEFSDEDMNRIESLGMRLRRWSP